MRKFLFHPYPLLIALILKRKRINRHPEPIQLKLSCEIQDDFERIFAAHGRSKYRNSHLCEAKAVKKTPKGLEDRVIKI